MTHYTVKLGHKTVLETNDIEEARAALEGKMHIQYNKPAVAELQAQQDEEARLAVKDPVQIVKAEITSWGGECEINCVRRALIAHNIHEHKKDNVLFAFLRGNGFAVTVRGDGSIAASL